ncbi:MAG: hypothetical protein H6682_09865 [Candidatus Eisenbacteria bacterium]|nr:hypothetical protein [Candidatus Eisenbacteria bacterium]
MPVWLTLVAMAGIAVALGALMGVVRWIGVRHSVHPEVQRKAVHIGMGLVVLPLPWIFDVLWPVLVMTGASVVALLAMRWHPGLRAGIGKVLGGVDRLSLGEVYFPIAVALIFALSHDDPLFYVIPIVILALADAVAALIGVRYGTLSYITGEGTKSIEGSVAFFFVAFLSVLVPLLLFTQVERTETLLVSLTIALLVMMLESVAWNGLDNLFVPIGAYAFLQLYVPLDATRLAIRLLAGVVLLTFVSVWRKRSALDDSALVASAMVGYGTLMIGGWTWVVAPLAFFLAAHLVWPRLGAPRVLTVQGVIAVSVAGLCWLFAYAATHESWLLVPFATSFGTTLALYGVSRFSKVSDRDERSRKLLGNLIASWLATSLPAAVAANVLAPHEPGPMGWGLPVDLSITLLTIIALAAVFFRLLPWLRGRTSPEDTGNLVFAALGLVGSLIPCLRWLV